MTNFKPFDKKYILSTKLCDLYGNDNYEQHIEVGKEYWYYFGTDSDVGRKYGPGDYKLKVTYIRSGCLFYVLSDYPDIEEDFCPTNCFMASQFVVAKLNPVKYLSEISCNPLLKELVSFDNSLTIIEEN